MSPNMFSVTTTSKRAGSVTRNMAAASTSRQSNSTSGNCSAMACVATLRHSREVASTLALSTSVRRLLRRRAISAARTTTRSISSRV